MSGYEAQSGRHGRTAEKNSEASQAYTLLSNSLSTVGTVVSVAAACEKVTRQQKSRHELT